MPCAEEQQATQSGANAPELTKKGKNTNTPDHATLKCPKKYAH